MAVDCLPEPDGAPTMEVLFQQHTPAVTAICLAYARNLHDAEDLVQETLLKATASIGDLREPAAIRSWLLQIARRLCINHCSRRRHTVPLPEEVPAPAEVSDPQVGRLHHALAGLPVEYRKALCLYYLDGRSCAGVAEVLGISEGAVRVRLTRGRMMLHKLLREEDQ